MPDLWQRILLLIAEDQGIVGVVAVLSEWTKDSGGLEWIKKCVAAITQEQVDRRINDTTAN